jgi:hypothetical protein
MGLILDLLEYIHVNKDPNTMAKKGKKHIRERVKKYLNKIGWPLFPLKLPPPLWSLVGMVLGRHSGVCGLFIG